MLFIHLFAKTIYITMHNDNWMVKALGCDFKSEVKTLFWTCYVYDVIMTTHCRFVKSLDK